MSDRILDARNLICPMPVLKARKALKSMQSGDVLEVLATDPSAARDFALFCETTGHRMKAAVPGSEAGVTRFIIVAKSM